MSGPDYFKPRPRKADWRRHERELAERSGARQTPGSGSNPMSPGDATDMRTHREGKATIGASITIRPVWLQKLIEQAVARAKMPVLELRMEGAEPPVPTDWIMVTAVDFQALMERAYPSE